MKFKFILFLFLVTCSLLLIYSFSQIDLNLTLSSNPTYQSFQSSLTNLGYFHRPLSTAIYISLILLLVTCYLLLIHAAKKKQITQKQLWLLILLAVIILLPSYPAFSHDIFNYLFDARIVTKYGLSPWHFKALDFPSDTWIRFMRWTHRPSVYPPVWIGLSLLPSWLGMGKFVLTLGLFKITIAGAYVGSAKLIYNLAKRMKLKNPLVPFTLYSFNPLVLVEGLVNGHIEFVMIFFGLLAMITHQKVLRWLSFLASIGIKFMTFYLFPVFLNPKWLRQAIWFGIIILVGWIAYYGFQPWYILWVLPFALLVGKWEAKLFIAASISSLFWHLPFISNGDFNLPPWQFRLLYVIIPFIIFMIFITFMSPKEKQTHETRNKS